MNTTIADALGRIAEDVAIIREQLTGNPAPAPSNAVPITSAPIRLKKTYSKAAAIEEKARIDDAYARGEIDYDKKRGMKMVVTKATKGWAPPRPPAPVSGHGRGGHGSSAPN